MCGPHTKPFSLDARNVFFRMRSDVESSERLGPEFKFSFSFVVRRPNRRSDDVLSPLSLLWDEWLKRSLYRRAVG